MCARAFAPPYLIAGIVLLSVTIVHIDLFHMDDVTGWAWLFLYAIFPPTTIALLLRQVNVPGTDPPRTAPMHSAAVLVLGLQGGVMVALGTALDRRPHGRRLALAVAADASSPGRRSGRSCWPRACCCWTACRERDWTRVRPAMVQYVVLAVLQLGAVARFSGTFDWDEAGAWLYLGFLLGVLAMALLGAARRSPPLRRTPGRGARASRRAGAGTPGPTRKGALMGTTADDVKGRAKEAAGDLTDDRSLKMRAR